MVIADRIGDVVSSGFGSNEVGRNEIVATIDLVVQLIVEKMGNEGMVNVVTWWHRCRVQKSWWFRVVRSG